jgi:hypothetical protein
MQTSSSPISENGKVTASVRINRQSGNIFLCIRTERCLSNIAQMNFGIPGKGNSERFDLSRITAKNAGPEAEEFFEALNQQNTQAYFFLQKNRIIVTIDKPDDLPHLIEPLSEALKRAYKITEVQITEAEVFSPPRASIVEGI